MLGISDMYSVNHKLTSFGIEGYAIEKKYEDTHNVLKVKNSKATEDDQKKR